MADVSSTALVAASDVRDEPVLHEDEKLYNPFRVRAQPVNVPTGAKKKNWNSSGLLLQTHVGMHLVALRTSGVELSFRERIFLLINEPASSRQAFRLGRLFQLLIFGSAVTSMFETVTNVTYSTGAGLWIGLKAVLSTFFTIELVLRLVTYVPSSQALRDVYVLLDVLAVVPFWVRVLLYSDTMRQDTYLTKEGAGMGIRVLEAVSSVRVLKLCRYFHGSALLGVALRDSAGQLVVPLFMLTIILYCVASVVYEIEWDEGTFQCTKHWVDLGVDSEFLATNPEGVTWGCDVCDLRQQCEAYPDDGCTSDLTYKCTTCAGYPPNHPECNGVSWGQTFKDIPFAGWFAMVTASTVGYGDASPSSWQGQLFVVFAISCSLTFLAMPLSIVGNVFGSVWERRQIEALNKHLGQLLAENGIGPHDVVAAFNELDESGDGVVSSREFLTFCDQKKICEHSDEARELWKALDSDGSGRHLSLKEFVELCFPDMADDLPDLDDKDNANAAAEREKAAALEAQQAISQLSERQAGIVSEQMQQTARVAAIEHALESMLEAYRATSESAAAARKKSAKEREERGNSKLLEESLESLSPRLGEMSAAEKAWRERIMRGGQKSRPARASGRLR